MTQYMTDAKTMATNRVMVMHCIPQLYQQDWLCPARRELVNLTFSLAGSATYDIALLPFVMQRHSNASMA